MPTAQTGSPMATHSVNLINEDNTRRLLLGLLEHIAHPGGAYADEHLDKVRAGNREERHLGFTGNRLSQQGFTRTGLAHHENTSGNAPTQLLEPARITQKLDQFLHIFLRLFHPRDVSERGSNLIFA